MSGHVHHQADPSQEQSFWRSRSGLVFIAFGIVAAIYLLFEHTAHVIQYLPYGIILLCPLMHVFMHGRHGGHGGHGGGSTGTGGAR
jgi:hypothetical protein